MTKKFVIKSESPAVKLLNKDKKLKTLIDKIGDFEIILNEDYFIFLVQAVIGQQLSPKAAETIWQRVKNKVLANEPE